MIDLDKKYPDICGQLSSRWQRDKDRNDCEKTIIEGLSKFNIPKNN